MIKFFNRKKTYILMHRNIPVLSGEYSLTEHAFTIITSVMNPAHLPIGTLKAGTVSLKALNHWFRWRGIPSYRLGLNQFLDRIHLEDPLDLVEKEYALSVSDTYWLKEEKDSTTWDSVNFFHRDFNQTGFARTMFSIVNYNPEESALHTPNNITCGYHKKAWVKRDGNLFLLKGGSPTNQQEPINEWLANAIAFKLGLFVLPYKTEMFENNVVSICPCMTNEKTDLVTTENVLASGRPPAYDFQLQYYIDLLKEHGIKDAEKCMSDQILLDYLMLNTDRHTQNMGILVDAETMQWKSVAPIFDNGTSLACLMDEDEIIAEEQKPKCRLLNNKNVFFEEMVPYIKMDQYDFTGLEELPQKYGDHLVQYQKTTHISDQRIELSYTLFYKRVLALKKAAAHKI